MDLHSAATTWRDAQEQLRHQMTQATYDAIVHPTHIHQVDGLTWTIAVHTEAAYEQLSRRHKPQVSAALAIVAGAGITVQFIQAPPPGSTRNGKPDPAELTGAELTETDLIATRPEPHGGIAAVDYEALWFDPGGSGYDRMAKYWGQFWRAYLSRLNVQAYSLWEYLQVSDKRSVKGKNFTWWTPVEKHQVRPLGRVLGCAPATISGGFRQCSIFNTALAIGQELEDCCETYCPTKMNVSRFGNPQCLFWREGAFEALYKAGLLAIRVTGDNPKSTWYHLQVWRMLPLLTPTQVDQLHEVERAHHDAWLKVNAHKTGLTASEWEADDQPSGVPLLPGYDQGREIYDHYQPNPLLDDYSPLDSMESNKSNYDNLLDSMESNNSGDHSPLDSMESNKLT